MHIAASELLVSDYLCPPLCFIDGTIQTQKPRLDPDVLQLSTSHLARHCGRSGWVSVAESASLDWLPLEYRHLNDLSLRISAMPSPHPLRLDLSEFVHGDSRTLIAVITLPVKPRYASAAAQVLNFRNYPVSPH